MFSFRYPQVDIRDDNPGRRTIENKLGISVRSTAANTDVAADIHTAKTVENRNYSETDVNKDDVPGGDVAENKDDCADSEADMDMGDIANIDHKGDETTKSKL